MSKLLLLPVLIVCLTQNLLVEGALLPKLDGKIVGGVPAIINEFPYQVSLQYRGSHMCGASILSAKYIITAAHCTDGIKDTSLLRIRAGSTYNDEGGVIISVNKIYQNPTYNSHTVDNDISILELSDILPGSVTIQSIGLPELDEYIQEGSKAIVTGWGYLTEGGSVSKQLQVVTVPVVDNEKCGKAYGYSAITPQMMCAGAAGGKKDACQGDSGGPLVIDGKLMGIVSWGYGCARPKYPGIYARVPKLRSFISEITGL